MSESLNMEEESKTFSVRVMQHENTWLAVAGFGDGRSPRAKEYGQHLKLENSDKQIFP